MQSIGLWMCNHLRTPDTVDPPRQVVLDELARKEILFNTSCTVDFRALPALGSEGHWLPETEGGMRRSPG